ncbi:DNA-3-methyladenine glycosylase 2 family protein [Maricaulis sp.]|uniref:DNA-3-methyladenine glycosylase family protein n=1 Tax=Maricaulis sp. TaxID=1486257 RepID=UPI0026345F23|nr:DNA-3-methyladenine glycosylase 2 family protein [Maricaulis sp.]MDF1769271.1 DNA-3-methyladenine glycosylase 2 family protein [Maricaulis sp.]
MSHRAVHDHLLAASEPLFPDLHAAIRKLGPMELPRRDDLPFPAYLCRAIAGQQISVKAAQSIWARVEDSSGDVDLLDHFCAGNTDTLRACGLSGAKTRTIITIAETHRTVGLDTGLLKSLPIEQRTARLTEIWGVGQWTADMMNIFYFGEGDVWPDGDVAARKTLERLTSKRRKTVRTAGLFKPYRSWLAYYMWAHVDAPPDGEPG